MEIIEDHVELHSGGKPQVVRVAYLCRSLPGDTPPYPLRYLHTVRSGSAFAVAGSRAGSFDAFSYYSSLSSHLPDLTKWAESHQFDAMLLAPSSRYDAEPYFAALYQQQSADCLGLSFSFSKVVGWSAGSASADSEEARANILCKLQGSVAQLRRVCIVDDVLNTGKTIAAIIGHLTRCGLPTNAEITAFVPLWMRPETGQALTVQSR